MQKKKIIKKYITACEIKWTKKKNSGKRNQSVLICFVSSLDKTNCSGIIFKSWFLNRNDPHSDGVGVCKERIQSWMEDLVVEQQDVLKELLLRLLRIFEAGMKNPVHPMGVTPMSESLVEDIRARALLGRSYLRARKTFLSFKLVVTTVALLRYFL